MAHPVVEMRPTVQQLVDIILHPNIADEMGQPDNAQAICPICDKNFKNRGSKRFHMEKTHQKRISSISELLGLRPGFSGDAQFYCPVLNCAAIRNKSKCFDSAKQLIQHFQKAHFEKRYQCADCTARYALERDLRYHRRKLCPNLTSNLAITDENHRTEDESDRPETAIVKHSSVGIQTEWLTPARIVVIGNYKAILPRKSISNRSIHTQTDVIPISSENADQGPTTYHSVLSYPPYPNHQTFVDQSAQVQMDTSEHYQHSYAQTIYPQTIDFGVQHPAAGAPPTYSTRGQIYLNPLQVASTQTQVSPLMGPVFNGSAVGSICHSETQTPPNEHCYSSHNEAQWK